MTIRRSGKGPRLRDLSPRQAETLVSPVRQEIVDAISAAGPSTVSQISAWLGMKPDRLYYHLAALVRAGLLVERDRVRTGKRFGALYDVVAPAPAPEDRPRAKSVVVQRVVQTALRLAERDFRNAIKGRSIDEIGLGQDVAGGRVKGWLTPTERIRFNDYLQQAMNVLRTATPRKGTVAVACSFIVAPVARRSDARSTTREREPRI